MALALQRLRQKDHKFKAILTYTTSNFTQAALKTSYQYGRASSRNSVIGDCGLTGGRVIEASQLISSISSGSLPR